MSIESVPATAGKGFFGSIFGSIGLFFTLIFKNFRVVVTVFFILIFVGHASYLCIKEKSFMPLIMTTGQLIVSQDQAVYEKMLLIEKNNWRLPSAWIEEDEKEGELWRDIKSFLGKAYFVIQIVGAGWFIYVFGYLWFLLFEALTKSPKLINLALVIGFMMLLQITYSLAFLMINYNCGEEGTICWTKEERMSEAFSAMKPLKGLIFSKHSFAYNMIFTGNLWKHTFIEPVVPMYKGLVNATNTSSEV